MIRLSIISMEQPIAMCGCLIWIILPNMEVPPMVAPARSSRPAPIPMVNPPDSVAVTALWIHGTLSANGHRSMSTEVLIKAMTV